MNNPQIGSLETALTEACQQADVRVRSYSGRGMYGAECVGVVLGDGCSSPDDLVTVLATYGGLDPDWATYLAETAHIDSLGRDWVFYWPRLTWTQEWANAAE